MLSVSPPGGDQAHALGDVAKRSIQSVVVREKLPLTVDELMRDRSTQTLGRVLVSYPYSGTSYKDYTARQLDVFAYRVAKRLSSQIPTRSSSSENPSVIGLLGPSDLSYLVTLLAISKLGHTVLFLSTRISREAYASLLTATECRHLIISNSFESMAKNLQEDIPDLQVDRILQNEAYDYPLDDIQDTQVCPQLNPKQEANQVAWIIHSSGSTGLPKPIYQTQKAAVMNYATNMNMRGFVTLPLFHAHGIGSVFRAIYSGKQIHMYNAGLPLTQKYLIEIIRSHNFEIFYGVPYALKLLAETDEGVDLLRKFKVVMFGGSACPDSLGNKLVENGVNLISHYGTTETGQLMTSFRPLGDKAWDYVRPSEQLKPFLSFEDRGGGLFELICLDGWPSKVATNRPDGSYATKDLFTKHKTLEAYKYFARLDDTIILVNGEKANPLELEGAIRGHPLASEAVIFGAGKPNLGLIIIPSIACQGKSRDEIIEGIWPTIESIHSRVPAYAKLSKDMVTILPIDAKYPQTDKGTVIRQAFYRQFAKEIEDAYNEETPSTAAPLTGEELRGYIRRELSNVLNNKECNELTDDTDFFTLGMDSLQATHLRSLIVRQVNTNGQKLGLNVVFEYPTIKQLAAFLESLQTGTAGKTEPIEESMRRLITKYGYFGKHNPVSNNMHGRFVVLTGVTGSLGAHIAAKLARRDDTSKVYCLVRSSSADEAKSRTISSLQARAVFESLSPSAVEKIVALPSNLSLPRLGLADYIYEQIRSEITDLIHCAWSVNFRLQLGSFENDCIAGSRNLVELCLGAARPSPASFNFCSSASTVSSTEEDDILEALPAKLSYAQSMGYAQSKLIMEHLCMIAFEQTGIQARVLRIGQIIGDRKHGIWNATEAIPLMLQSAVTIGALPRLDEYPLWLPVDIVADSLIDIALSTCQSGILNIVNQHAFHWTRDLLPQLHKAGLDFEELEQRAWLQRLRASTTDLVANPPIKLLEFFASKYDNDISRRNKVWHTENARRWSPALDHAEILNQELADKLIQYFKTRCW